MLYQPINILLRQSHLGVSLLLDRQLNTTNYPVGAMCGQYLAYWAMLKHIFNYPKVAQKSTTLILSRRATQQIIIFIFCYTELFFSSLDYAEILLKEHFQLLYHGLLFLLSVAATEAGHCWEYLVYICAWCVLLHHEKRSPRTWRSRLLSGSRLR